MALAARARDGDAAAFELIVRRYSERLWQTAYRLLLDRWKAEDAVQETFAKAFKSIHSFRGDASLLTWLTTICRHHCVDQLKQLCNQMESVAEIVPIELLREQRVSEGADARVVERMQIQQALTLLPNDVRTAAVLVLVQGLSSADAAAVARVPQSTMRSRVRRARELLVDALHDERRAEGGGGAKLDGPAGV